MSDVALIYIPSRSRVDKLVTPYTLPEALRPRCRIVVRDNEAEAYRAAHPTLTFRVLPPDFKGGIGTTRQWMMDNTETRWHFQFDDDVTGLYFKKTGANRVTRVLDVEAEAGWVTCIKTLTGWLKDGIAFVGLASREMAWRDGADFYNNGQVTQGAVGIDIASARSVNARYDRVELHEDSDMCLQLLEAGYPNRMCLQWSTSRRPGGSAGGCALYRTHASCVEALKIMEKLHPGLVVPEIKERADGHKDYRLRTAWKKSFGARARGIMSQESLL